MKKKLEKTKPYRRCVLAVFQNTEGKVLVALRSDTKMWQFPQGGVDFGESLKGALYREMKEEIGNDQFEILKELKETVCYDFPEDLKGPHISEKYRGQEQTWFLCKFKEGEGPKIEEITSDEFLECKWVDPIEALESVIHWKKESYHLGLNRLKLL